MIIRSYQTPDCPHLAQLFYDTVHSINAKDYTQEQLNAWATGSVDLEEWNQSLLAHFTVIAVENDVIVGFGDIDSTGYLDRLYVHKDYQGRGIASAICEELEGTVKGKSIHTYASITARPFFEKRGYKMIRPHEAERHGIILRNYLMKKG